MNIFITNKLTTYVSATLGLSVVLYMLFTLAPVVSANQDPGSCDANGVGLSLSVYRADQTSVISGSAKVESRETVYYRATLSHLGGTNCNFSGGSLSIVTPDSVSHEVTNPVPLVSSGSPHLSSFQSYVVSEADVAGGNITASADYVGGESHTGEQHDDAEASVNRNTPYQDVSLEVTKTAVPSAEEGFRWTIDKSVTPEVWDLFDGNSGTSEYTIDVEKVSAGVSYAVAGDITIHNPAQFATAHVTAVDDTITGLGAVTVNCPGGLPQDIAPGADLVCTYSHDLGSDDTARTNHVEVTTSGDVGGGSDDADFDPATATPVDTSGPVHVDDTFDAGDKNDITESGSYTYTRTFSCDADEGQIDNTATIVGTAISDDASVTVNCYDLAIEKTAEGTFDREWDWTIVKTAEPTNLTLESGETDSVNYEVTVDATPTNGAGMVSGSITITNNHPTLDADLVGVTDSLGPVNCPSATVPANGGTLVCTYGPIETEADVNTATAEQQNYDYDKNGAGSPSGTTEYDGQADIEVVLGDETDECIDVTDTLGGVLGTVCATDPLPHTFEYSLDFGTEGDVDVVLECGDSETLNTATFVTNDTATEGSDDAIVAASVSCVQFAGCTPGYWKNNWWSTDASVDPAYSDLFDSLFGVDVTIKWSDRGKPQDVTDPTMLQALGASGGGVNAMVRHAAAALLNATFLADMTDTEYPMDAAEVIDLVQDAVNSGDYSSAQSVFADYNEIGCSLNAHGEASSN